MAHWHYGCLERCILHIDQHIHLDKSTKKMTVMFFKRTNVIVSTVGCGYSFPLDP